jgi:hypothetical protein
MLQSSALGSLAALGKVCKAFGNPAFEGIVVGAAEFGVHPSLEVRSVRIRRVTKSRNAKTFNRTFL